MCTVSVNSCLVPTSCKSLTSQNQRGINSEPNSSPHSKLPPRLISLKNGSWLLKRFTLTCLLLLSQYTTVVSQIQQQMLLCAKPRQIHWSQLLSAWSGALNSTTITEPRLACRKNSIFYIFISKETCCSGLDLLSKACTCQSSTNMGFIYDFL